MTREYTPEMLKALEELGKIMIRVDREAPLKIEISDLVNNDELLP